MEIFSRFLVCICKASIGTQAAEVLKCKLWALMLTKAINVVRLVVNPTTLEYKIYVSAFWRYHQNKYQIHKCDIAIIIGEGELFNNRITADILITSAQLQYVIMNVGWSDIMLRHHGCPFRQYHRASGSPTGYRDISIFTEILTLGAATRYLSMSVSLGYYNWRLNVFCLA